MAYGTPPSPGRPEDPRPPVEPLLVQHVDASRFTGSRLRFAFIAAVSLVMAVVIVWSALPHPPAPTHRTTQPSGGTTVVSSTWVSNAVLTQITPWPSFHEWRVAYVDAGETMRAMTTDGTEDAAGPPVPGLLAAAADLNEYPRLAALSPDSHYLAYSLSPASSPSTSSGPIMLLDVGAVSPPYPYAGTESLHAQNLFWSLDSSHLAFESNANGVFDIYLISPMGPTPLAVPGVGDGTNGIYRLLGWIDAWHLAVLANPPLTQAPGGGPSTTLGSLDVRTGQLRAIAPLPPLPTAYLAPDGARVVVDGAGGAIAGFEVVDTATGVSHQFPRLTQQVDSGWDTIAWKPGEHVLAVTANTVAHASSSSAGPAIQLLDLDHDTLTSLSFSEYALGWSPDGNTLIIGTPANLTGNRTGDLRAVTFLRPGVIQTTALTHSAAAFLGFMRTA